MPRRQFHHSQFSSRKQALRVFAALVAVSAFLAQATLSGQTPEPTSNTWAVRIVLPARVVAGQRGTLAVLGVDGRLAPNVTIELGSGQRVTTDATGRALFAAPSTGGVLVAKASGVSAAALVDSTGPEDTATPESLSLATVASLREPFSICGRRFRPDADLNHVRLNGEPALVMASSPECLAVLPNAKTAPGMAKISVQTPSGQWTSQVTLVSLEPQFPRPALVPGEKGHLFVNLLGSDQPLRVAVGNQTPGVLRFVKGDAQELTTTGGAQNFASVEVEAIQSGDFSLGAQLLPPPDEDAAQRYLEAAVSLADKAVQRDLDRLSKELGRHPRNLDQLRRSLNSILAETTAGDFRILVAAARTSL